MKRKGLLQGIRDLLQRLFPSARGHGEEPDLASLTRNIGEMVPASDEVRDLRDGMLGELRDAR